MVTSCTTISVNSGSVGFRAYMCGLQKGYEVHFNISKRDSPLLCAVVYTEAHSSNPSDTRTQHHGDIWNLLSMYIYECNNSDTSHPVPYIERYVHADTMISCVRDLNLRNLRSF